MSKRDGGPAFPTYDDTEFTSGGHSLVMIGSGMSLRAWLAGKALTGLLANPAWNAAALSVHHNIPEDKHCAVGAFIAVHYADATLAELTKPTGNEQWTTEEILRQEG